ncbi:hypothetical protein G3260_000239 [Streptomyces albus]|uniref:hypothetical protein n=1 Tax=Streptomyces albus TaxID=1888 RepID=UPI000A6832F1|nr:hypothetical protein [Streptomyces albus]QID34449.1 hypothetical protein G3260_000239 [Streptomyces albus]
MSSAGGRYVTSGMSDIGGMSSTTGMSNTGGTTATSSVTGTSTTSGGGTGGGGGRGSFRGIWSQLAVVGGIVLFFLGGSRLLGFLRRRR